MKQDEASSTARVIAASTLLLASEPKSAALVATGAAELCRRFLSLRPGDRALAWSATNPATRMLWRLVERMTHPGVMAHYWHRKRWIESRCRDAVEGGFTRLVVIGAGFDTLGVRLAQEHRSLDVLEIDHPATQRVKRLALEAAPIGPPNLRFEAVDLAQAPLPASLFDGRPTLVVMEGFLMYLPLADIERLMQRLAAAPAQRLRLVFSFMAQWEDGSIGFRPRSWLVDRWMAWRGEPFAWAIEPGRIANMLAPYRFQVHELVPAGVLEGENLVACERQADCGQHRQAGALTSAGQP